MRMGTRVGTCACALVLSAPMLAGCGGGGGGGAEESTQPGVPDLEATLEFVAIIEGRVTDGVTGEPLEGITVELSSLGVDYGEEEADDAEEENTDGEEGNDNDEEEADSDDGEEGNDDAEEDEARKGLSIRSVTTDENGEYQLTVNTPGSHTLVRHGRANGKRYARTRQTIVVDPNNLLPEGAQGEYVLGLVYDAEMFPKDGTLEGTVFGSNRRDVIADARVVFRYNSGNIVDPDLPTETTTDDEGKFSVEGLPIGVSINVQVRPIDRDDDGRIDTENLSQNVILYEGGENEQFFGPVGANVNPRLLWHNVDSMRSFSEMPELIFVYSHPMDTSESSAEVSLWDASTGVELPTEERWDGDGFELTVTPAAPLLAGRNYRIRVTAWSQEPSAIGTGNLSFRTEGGADDEPELGMAPVLLSDPTNLEFYTDSLRIGVPPLDNIEAFRVFARTDPDGEWVRVDDYSPNGHTPYQELELFFSNSVKARVTTPQGSDSLFSHGGPLQIAVAAVVANVPGPLSDVLEVERENCLIVQMGLGTDNSPTTYADNREGGQPKPMVVALTSTDGTWLPMDASPSLSLRQTSLVTDVLDEDDFDMVRVNPWTIEWRAWLEPDVDAQFVEVALDAAGLTDIAGNELCDEEGFDGQSLLPTSGSTENVRWTFEDGAEGWERDADWQRGLAGTVGPVNGGPGCVAPDDDACESASYFGTNLDGVRADNTESTLSTPTFHTPDSSPRIAFSAWLDLNLGDNLTVVFVDEDQEDDALAEVLLMSFPGSASPFWAQYTSASGLIPGGTNGHVEFRYEATDTAGAATEAGAFIDEVTLLGTTSRTHFCPDLTSCDF